MDLPELLAEASERSQIPGLASRGEHLTRLAEAEINKRLRVAQQEDTLTLTTDANGVATLPSDMLTIRRASIGSKELRHWSLGDIQSNSRTGYAIRGGRLITNKTNAEIELTIYRGLPPLRLDEGDWDEDDFSSYDFATDQTTNWLAEADPEIYIMAVLKQWYAFKMDLEKASVVAGYLDTLLENRNAFDIRTRFAGTRFRTAGPIV